MLTSVQEIKKSIQDHLKYSLGKSPSLAGKHVMALANPELAETIQRIASGHFSNGDTEVFVKLSGDIGDC